MNNTFATVSGKGGVGKSTFSVGLGLAFARLNKRVLLADLDAGLRCLDLMLGVDEAAVFDLSDILNGKEIASAVYPCEINENLFLIPAPASGEIPVGEEFTKFALAVSEMFDIVIFDFPAGINTPIYKCLPESTLFLTVAVPDPVSVRDAGAVSESLSLEGLKSRLIINRFVRKQHRKYPFKNIDEIIDGTNTRLVGIIPESEELRLISVTQKISGRGRANAAFTRIAKRLGGEKILLPKLKII